MTIFNDQRLTLITLGVGDFKISLDFYTRILGWKPAQVVETTAFFNLGGFALALYPHPELAADMNLSASMTDRFGYPGFSLSYNARSEDEVDDIFARLKIAGVPLLKEPHKTEWGGYSSYFTDPDGHAWEVAYNPYWPLDAKGGIEVTGDTK